MCLGSHITMQITLGSSTGVKDLRTLPVQALANLVRERKQRTSPL
jgi:hypothetical protein